MAISKKNQNAINIVIQNGGMCYPRELATAELTNAKTVKYAMNNEIYDVSNITPSQLSSRKFYEYSAQYGFVFDLITAICTELPYAVYDDPNLNYYVISLKRETVEKYALDGLKGLNGDLWENIGKLNNHPEVFKNIPIISPDGKITLATVQPVIISCYRENEYNIFNSKGGNLTKLENVSDFNMITRIEIQFFKPLFSGLLDRGSNWIALPKAFTGHIIKVVEHHKNDLELQAKIKQLRARPSVETIRKAIMFLNMHESEKATTQLNLNLIDFCLHVLPSELSVCETTTEDGNTSYKLYVRNYMTVKNKIELIFYFFNCMHREENLKGFKFKTGNVYVDKNNNNIRVSITRDNNTVLEYVLDDPAQNIDDIIPF